MKLTDEILNKYIDNELSVSEIKEIKEFISSNPSELDKLKALKVVDNSLRELEFDDAPENFTEKMMSRLNVVYSSKPQKNYFIKIMFSLFGLGFLGIFAFGITQTAGVSSQDNNVIKNIFDWINETLPSFSFGLNISSDSLMLIISTLVLVTLIATYVIINTHKEFKNNIENLSH